MWLQVRGGRSRLRAVTYLTIPGGIEVQLYEPKYTKRASKPAATAKKVKAKTRKLVTRAKPRAPR